MTDRAGADSVSPAETRARAACKSEPAGAARTAPLERFIGENILQGALTTGASPPAWLYGIVVFTAAWLVFWIQPLAVRDVLPVLGGSPAVWNTAMVFFQAALLAGYAFAHFLVRHVSPTHQIACLGALLFSGLAG